MSKPIWYALGVLAGTFAVIRFIEVRQESDSEAYKKKVAADAIRIAQENLTKPIVRLPA